MMETLGVPGEIQIERMTKEEADASVKDMKDFVDFMDRLLATHVWDEEKGDYIPRSAA